MVNHSVNNKYNHWLAVTIFFFAVIMTSWKRQLYNGGGGRPGSRRSGARYMYILMGKVRLVEATARPVEVS